MWKHKNFINLQLCAGNIVETTINWDAHITKVVLGLATLEEWTQSGQTIVQSAYPANDFIVTLQDGYVIDTVTATNGFTISNITDTTFHLNDGVDFMTEVTITITSKQSTPQPTLTFKHFYDAGTIGSGTYKFRHYSQQEPSSGETWVLNETVDIPTQSFTVDFVSNGQNFKTIKKVYTQIYYDDVHVYVKNTPDGIHWVLGEVYRTITFSETVTDSTLLAWLQANGVKQ